MSLPAPMRKSMYLACLKGAAEAMNAILLGSAGRSVTKQAYQDASHDLHRAMNLLKVELGAKGLPTPTAPMQSDVEAVAVSVVSMASDALDSNRPTPQDVALYGAVAALYAYVKQHTPTDKANA